MPFIFYILQLLCPSQYSGMGVEAPVKPVESFYSSGNTVVAFKTEIDYRRAVECLSLSMYHEARSKEEGRVGMLLTGLVILNRVRHNEYPDDVCSVVYAPRSFSWTKDGKSDRPKEQDRYRLAETIAKQLIEGKHSGKLPPNITFFKTCDSYSEFFTKLRFYKQYKSHCFYHHPRKKK